jgi:hypothetical protein
MIVESMEQRTLERIRRSFKAGPGWCYRTTCQLLGTGERSGKMGHLELSKGELGKIGEYVKAAR